MERNWKDSAVARVQARTGGAFGRARGAPCISTGGRCAQSFGPPHGRERTGGQRGQADWLVKDVGALVAEMDEWGVQSIVNLDGDWGDSLDANLDRYDRAYLVASPRSAASTGTSASNQGGRTASPRACRVR